MQKISDSTSTANADGEYTEGNPGAGVDATLIKARWLNTIQRELINLIAGAGIPLDGADDSQALKAVSRLAASAAEFPNITKKPDTLAGYGIVDAYTKTEAGQSFASRAATLAGYNITDAYTVTQVDGLLSGKAGRATTLAGYGIVDAYTKTEAGQSFASRAVTLAGYNITDAYTVTQVDGLLAGKASKAAATESFAGIIAISTQNQTNAGIDDATSITPKKMRAGFLSSFTANGFIAFPTWLGGLVIQWGRTATIFDGASTTVSLPLSFPATALQVWTSIYGDVSGDGAACRVSSGQFLSRSEIKVSYNETNAAIGGATISWLCVGF
jgi:hypothetical protein